jgi:hypothetical protein
MANDVQSLRERVHEAIEQPVEEAQKLLSELTTADAETKLSILISGWGRGLAAAFEELAIAVDELRQYDEPPEGRPARLEQAHPSRRPDGDEQRGEAERGDGDEERLLDEARKSREQTGELRKEAEQVRRELEQ